MREAGHHDDVDVVEAANHGDTEKVSAAPFASLGFASPRMPAPLAEGFDIDLDDDAGDDDGDEEGETQVDAQRSANALKQMQALDATAPDRASLPALPFELPPSTPHSRGVPPGRPPIAAVPLPASPSFGRRPAAETTGVSTLKFPPTIVPPAIQPDPLPGDNGSEHLFSSSRLQFGSLASTPGLSPMLAPVLPTPRGVGRRTGILIAISTAAAVALIAGAWTAAQPETIPPVVPAGTLTSRLTATAPKGTGPVPVAPPPTVGVVVATPPPEAAAATVDLIAGTEPATATEAAAPEGAVPSPVAIVPAQQAPAGPSVRSTLGSKRVAAAAAKANKSAKKARVTRKAQAAANKRRLRAQGTADKADGFAPAHQSGTRPAASTRGGRGDPDDTLPPTD